MMKGKADGGGCLLVVVVWERRAGGRWALFFEEIRLLPIPTPFMIQHSHIRLDGKLNK